MPIRLPFLHLLFALALSLLGTIGPAVPTARAAGPVVTTEQARAELLVHAPQGLAVGASAWLGLKIEHRPGWHTYWLNPGDSGLPTSLQWQLPAGLRAGEIQWPVPERLPIGPLMNHGYEGTLLLPVPLSVERSPGVGPIRIKLRADWLICKDVCIPEGGDFELTLPPGAASSSIVGARALFDAARDRMPQERSSLQASARIQADGLSLDLRGLPASWQGRRLALFPETAHILAPAAEPVARWSEPGAWTGLMAYSPQRVDSPATLHFVVSPADGPAPTDGPPGLRVAVELKGDWAQARTSGADVGTDAAGGPAAGANPGGATSPLPPSQSPAPSFWLALLMAVLGGAILNLMPCVFPVLSLKAFGFAQHAQDRRALAVGGLAYTAGVVLSFAALAGLLLALRASGEQLGWGFQLQSPLFVAALALLFTLMGLNLLGLFEFAIVLPGRVAGAQTQNPVVDQALTGMLAVVVASPCTAPFMGASLGAAVTLPTAQALAVFVALGLGMALPYLLLCLMPAWAARLPRPGSWMLHFKHAMALPMLATVVWLLWVLGHQAGVDAVAGLLGVLLMTAFAIGAWNMKPATARATLLWRLGAGVALAATVLWAWPSLQEQGEATALSSGVDAPVDGAASRLAPSGSAAAVAWLPWSPAALSQAHSQGRTVFVDYTAAWCVTCQVNKRSTLRDAQVLKALADRGIVLMRADWTRRDAMITEELTRLGRTGVPVYAFYPPGAPTLLLPELLTPQMVIEAVAKLPATSSHEAADPAPVRGR